MLMDYGIRAGVKLQATIVGSIKKIIRTSVKTSSVKTHNKPEPVLKHPINIIIAHRDSGHDSGPISHELLIDGTESFEHFLRNQFLEKIGYTPEKLSLFVKGRELSPRQLQLTPRDYNIRPNSSLISIRTSGGQKPIL